VSGQELAAGLRRLELPAGKTVLVHSSLRAIKPEHDRAGTLYRALREVLGPVGTVVVPTFTPSNSLSSTAYRVATRLMPPSKVSDYHRNMPPFDPATTASGLGAFSEFVRTTENAVRSRHPQTSFAAVGPDAHHLMKGHALDCHLGERSPLARLYEHDAYVLLLGVGYDRCSSFHLAEYRYSAEPPLKAYQAVVLEKGHRSWHRFVDVRLDDSDFALIGKEMEQKISVSHATVFEADMRLFSLRNAVDFAGDWFRVNRKSMDPSVLVTP